MPTSLFPPTAAAAADNGESSHQKAKRKSILKNDIVLSASQCKPQVSGLFFLDSPHRRVVQRSNLK